MSTRACYRFTDPNSKEIFTIYKHHDGYPSGAAEAIANALPHAWPLPRFEADEFAAAFCAGNKESPGGVRVVNKPGKAAAYKFASDIEYVYDISRVGQSLTVGVSSVGAEGKEKRLFTGTLPEMVAKAATLDESE